MVGSALSFVILLGASNGGGASSAGGAAAAAPAAAIEWSKDLQAAQASARSSGKPLFVVFRCER